MISSLDHEFYPIEQVSPVLETSKDFEKEDLDIDESVDFCHVVSDQPQPLEVISDQKSELTCLETLNPNCINQTECLDKTLLKQEDTSDNNSEESGCLCINPDFGEYSFEHSISFSFLISGSIIYFKNNIFLRDFPFRIFQYALMELVLINPSGRNFLNS